MGTGTAGKQRQQSFAFEIVRIGNAILLCGDNTQWNPGAQAIIELQHKDFDFEDMAVVSDPPYGVEIMTDMSFERKTGTAQGKWFKEVHGNDNEFDPAPWLLGKEQILWGANHYAHKLPHNGRWLSWDKRCQVAPPRNQADCEMAWCSEYGAARIFYHVWDGFLRDSEKGVEREHPTQKPIALMEWCLTFTKCGTIFDPFMGAGSTGLAAIKAGRKFVGIEIDRDYFEISCRRLAELQSAKLPEHMTETKEQVDLFI